jgi:hypothetical protein
LNIRKGGGIRSLDTGQFHVMLSFCAAAPLLQGNTASSTAPCPPKGITRRCPRRLSRLLVSAGFQTDACLFLCCAVMTAAGIFCQQQMHSKVWGEK